MRWLLIFLCNVVTLYSAPRILVTIPPIHSIVSSIMNGVAVPDLLLSGHQSPHHFALKSSHIKKIIQADFIFWVGSELETFLIKPMQINNKKNLSLINLSAIVKKPLRHNCQHNHTAQHVNLPDPHIWLDLNNAIIITQTIAQKLIDIDPANQNIYQQNALNLIAEIKKKQIEWTTHLSQTPYNYISFHDAYQYFESNVNWHNVGIIQNDEHGGLSLKKLNDLQNIIKAQHVMAIFSEPQNSSKLVLHLAKQNQLCHYVLDPLGAKRTPGPDLYLKLMQDLYQAFNRCAVKRLTDHVN